jgi:hypothetical protein
MKVGRTRILNLTLYLCACLMISTGLILAFRLPPGSGGRGMTVAGLRRHDWGSIHEIIAYAFIALILIHLIVHWNWLVRVAGGGSAARVWLGFGGGLLIVFLSLFIL